MAPAEPGCPFSRAHPVCPVLGTVGGYGRQTHVLVSSCPAGIELSLFIGGASAGRGLSGPSSEFWVSILPPLARKPFLGFGKLNVIVTAMGKGGTLHLSSVLIGCNITVPGCPGLLWCGKQQRGNWKE
jgi:hypothetical protein